MHDDGDLDSINFMSDPSIFPLMDGFVSNHWWETWLLIASNLFLILPFISCIMHKMITRATVIILAFFASASYHFCKTSYPTFCTKRDFLFFFHLDFFFSFLLLVVSTLLLLPYQISKSGHYERKVTIGSSYNIHKSYNYPLILSRIMYEKFEFVITVLYAIVIAGILFYYGEPTIWYYVIILGSVVMVIIIVTLVIMKVYHVKPYYNKWIFLIGAILVILGVTLYSTQQFFDKNYYWVYHSFWHIFGALGIFAIIESKAV